MVDGPDLYQMLPRATTRCYTISFSKWHPGPFQMPIHIHGFLHFLFLRILSIRSFVGFACERCVHNEAAKMYEVCLKGSEIFHITILFQTKSQNYNLSPSKYSPWALTHFAILLCHASIHSWKDFSGMPRSSFVMAILCLLHH